MWLNESQIDRALYIVGQYASEFLPYVKYLSDWRDVINQNSDGWPYWSAGTRPSGTLQELVTKLVNSITGHGAVPPSAREFDKSLTPIKSFATRKKLPAPVLGGEIKKSSKPVSDEDLIRRKKIMELAANSPMLRDGELELDESAKISEGDDNGAYVQTWMWVPFSGTELNKEV